LVGRVQVFLFGRESYKVGKKDCYDENDGSDEYPGVEVFDMRPDGFVIASWTGEQGQAMTPRNSFNLHEIEKEG
jgi:hypothetical protein